MPDIDILACDFYRAFYRDLSIAGRKQKNARDVNNVIKLILDYRMPKIICFFIPQACLKLKQFVQLLDDINSRGYN